MRLMFRLAHAIVLILPYYLTSEKFYLPSFLLFLSVSAFFYDYNRIDIS